MSHAARTAHAQQRNNKSQTVALVGGSEENKRREQCASELRTRGGGLRCVLDGLDHGGGREWRKRPLQIEAGYVSKFRKQNDLGCRVYCATRWRRTLVWSGEKSSMNVQRMFSELSRLEASDRVRLSSVFATRVCSDASSVHPATMATTHATLFTCSLCRLLCRRRAVPTPNALHCCAS